MQVLVHEEMTILLYTQMILESYKANAVISFGQFLPFQLISLAQEGHELTTDLLKSKGE